MSRLPRLPSPTRRGQIVDDLVGYDVMLSDGFAFRTDDALESAYQTWIAAGRPRGATLRMDNEPSGQTKVVLTSRTDGHQTCADCYPHPRHQGTHCTYCSCGHASEAGVRTPPLPETAPGAPKAPEPPPDPAIPPVLRW